MLIINQLDVTQALTMRRAIDVMRETLVALERGQAVQPLRTMMRLPGDHRAFWIMPSYAGAPASLGIKVLTAFPFSSATVCVPTARIWARCRIQHRDGH